VTNICPWCSAELMRDATVCPSCKANLVADGEPNVPGVTAIDAESLIRSKSAPPQRSRLLAWISGEYVTDSLSQAESQAVAPPDVEVRREILRLELEAQVANLQAEQDSIRAEAAAEGRTIPDFDAPGAAEGVVEAESATDGGQADGGPSAETDPIAEDHPPA
jgi:hypothetical protein